MQTSSATILTALCALVAAAPARAQTESARPVRILVAAPPGTAADEQIRTLLPFLSTTLRRTLLVDNRGTGQGIPASETAARAEPNASTLLLGNSTTHAANPVLHQRLSYDPLRDFAPITQIASTGMIVAGHPRLPGNSLADLSSHARSVGAPLKLGGYEAVQQVAGEALARHLGFRLEPVLHPGSIPAMLALTAGRTDIALLTPYAARPHVHGARLKAYGITGTDRSSALPEIATLTEQGIDGYELPSWDGLFAPAGTASETVQTIHRAVVRALGEPQARSLYLELGITPVGSSPSEFAARVKRDLAIFRRIAGSREAGVRK